MQRGLSRLDPHPRGGVLAKVGNRIEAMTIDEDGVAYFALNKTLGGTLAPLLLKIDLNQVGYGQTAVADVIGNVPLTLDHTEDAIAELAISRAHATSTVFRNQASGTEPVDRLLMLHKSTAAITSDLGEMKNAGTTELVASGKAMAFNSSGGTLCVIYTQSDDLYEVDAERRRFCRGPTMTCRSSFISAGTRLSSIDRS